MTKKGDFFAAMFIVLAAGCLIFYGVLGFATNAIAQVCTLLFFGHAQFHCFSTNRPSRLYHTNFDAKA